MAQPLKDRLDERAIHAIAGTLPVDPQPFTARCLAGLGAMALKQRVDHIAQAMAEALPDDFLEALPHVEAACGQLDTFEAWPCFTFIERHGLAHPAESLEALRRMTHRFSAEFAVRPFLRADLTATLARMRSWLDDPDPHVRRLVSEGTRPRLPWGGHLKALIADPTPALPLLEALRHDDSEYVRRSVANHLNDVSRDHPDRLVALLGGWADDRPETTWITRHALRTLIKQGHPGALALQGFGPPEVDASLSVTPGMIDFPGVLRLDLSLTCRAAQRLVIDYAVHHVKADGSTSPKVFKWSVREVTPGRLALQRTHALRPISTRRYHPGVHRVEILVNGESVASQPFTLRM